MSILLIYQTAKVLCHANFKFYVGKQKNLTETGSRSFFREEIFSYKPEKLIFMLVFIYVEKKL